MRGSAIRHPKLLILLLADQSFAKPKANKRSELCEPRDQKELGARHAHLADEVEAKSREQPLEAQRIAAVLA